MLEFKLNMYFEKYKDIAIISRAKFRKKFIEENGEFPLLNELLLMIEKFQIEKYGELLETGSYIVSRGKKGSLNNKAQKRERSRFGTREERERRKKKYEVDSQ